MLPYFWRSNYFFASAKVALFLFYTRVISLFYLEVIRFLSNLNKNTRISLQIVAILYENNVCR